MNIPFGTDEDGLLDYVIQLSFQEHQNRFFKSVESVETASDEHLKILVAIEEGNAFALRELSAFTSAFSEVDSGGWLPLHRAAVYPMAQVLETVIYASCQLTLEEKTIEGETALTLAAQKGLVENVKLLLEKGASPHSTNNKNESPLLLAVRNGSYEMVLALILRGAVVEQICLKNWTTMHEAAKVGCSDVMRLLLRNGACATKEDENGLTPLGIAAEHAHAEVLQILILAGGDVNTWDGSGETALMEAAGSGNPDCVSLLLQCGANPNLANQTRHLPIHRAAYCGHYLALKILIPVTSISAINISGHSPVHSAAAGGHSQCLELLIENDFDVNAVLEEHISENYGDDRKTALFFAVSNGDATCTEMLLNAGAKPDLDPLRCLLVAIRAGLYKIVKMLLARQADVNCYFTVVSDTVFPTALQYCLSDDVMLRLLLNSGYDVERCFCCHHDNKLQTRCSGTDLNIQTLSSKEIMPFCDYISLEWFTKMSGSVVRILLDYVSHVPICSKLRLLLEKQREWPEICDILGNPRPLKHLCRLVMRRQMTPKRLSDPDIMDSAPFAPRVKSYLVYKEYDLYDTLGL